MTEPIILRVGTYRRWTAFGFIFAVRIHRGYLENRHERGCESLNRDRFRIPLFHLSRKKVED